MQETGSLVREAWDETWVLRVVAMTFQGMLPHLPETRFPHFINWTSDIHLLRLW